MRRGGCLELYYCNIVEWFWWDSSLISTTNWFNRRCNDLQCVDWDVMQVPNQPDFVIEMYMMYQKR